MKMSKFRLAVLLPLIISLSAFKGVNALIGDYGSFEAVELRGITDEVKSVNYGYSGYFEGEVPQGHSFTDYVIIRGELTFTAKYTVPLYVQNCFHINYHYYIAPSLGRAYIEISLWVREDATGLETKIPIYQGGGCHQDWWDPASEGGEDASWLIKKAFQPGWELKAGFTYTVWYYFKVEATQGSYVEQYGSDPYDTLGAWVDFSGFKSSGHLLLQYENAEGEVIKVVGGRTGPPTGGCPTLSVWNGGEFVSEGVLNIHSDMDVHVGCALETQPAPENQAYILKLAELGEGYNYSHSFIDHVRLYIIDEDNARHACRLVTAIHSRYGNVKRELSHSDDDRTELLKSDEIVLRFKKPQLTTAKAFVFEIEGHNPYKW